MIKHRKVIQLIPVFVKEGSFANCDYIHYTALCDDGTMWVTEDISTAHGWKQIPNVPQPIALTSSKE